MKKIILLIVYISTISLFSATFKVDSFVGQSIIDISDSKNYELMNGFAGYIFNELNSDIEDNLPISFSLEQN